MSNFSFRDTVQPSKASQ